MRNKEFAVNVSPSLLCLPLPPQMSQPQGVGDQDGIRPRQSRFSCLGELCELGVISHSSSISVSVIKCPDQKQLNMEKGFIWLTVPDYGPSLGESDGNHTQPRAGGE